MIIKYQPMQSQGDSLFLQKSEASSMVYWECKEKPLLALSLHVCHSHKVQKRGNSQIPLPYFSLIAARYDINICSILAGISQVYGPLVVLVKRKSKDVKNISENTVESLSLETAHTNRRFIIHEFNSSSAWSTTCVHKLSQLVNWNNTSGALQEPLTTVTSETGQRVTPISCCCSALSHHPLSAQYEHKREDFPFSEG